MATTINYPYTTSGNYIFDTDKIEVTGGVARLKDLSPTDSLFGVTFSTDETAAFSVNDGDLTGTLNNGATVSAGKGDCTGGTNKSIEYDGADNASPATQVGSIRVKYTPNYTGNPAATRGIFLVRDGPTNKNYISLNHDTASAWRMTWRDQNGGGGLTNIGFGTSVLTSGVEYEILFTYDFTTGDQRLYIDGTQIGVTTTGVLTRSTVVNQILLGTGDATTADGKFDDFAVYDTRIYTANYTAGYTLPDTRYDITNPTILTNTSFNATELTSLTETSTVSGSDAITYTLTANGQDRYVTGGSATDSDGTYSETSSVSDMNTDIENIITGRKLVKLKAFLHSDDGTTTPELDINSITYNAALADPTTPTLVNVEGFVYDNDGPISSQLVRIRPYRSGFSSYTGSGVGVFHKYEYQDFATTDSDGFFAGMVYASPSGTQWEFKIGTQSYRVTVPDQDTVDFSTLTITLVVRT